MFTSCLFNASSLRPYLNQLAVDFRMLEIGTYEGQTTCFVLDRYPDCQVDTIDPCTPYPIRVDRDLMNIGSNLEQRILENLAPYGHRVRFFKDTFENVAPALEKESYDLIFIDGDHRRDAVYTDACMSWLLLKRGGFMVFDDYTWKPSLDYPPDGPDCPKAGIDAFIERHHCDVIEKKYIVVIQK